jgi:hypothetical protein
MHGVLGMLGMLGMLLVLGGVPGELLLRVPECESRR